jgi:GT2 family glycosyltransferase
MFFVSFYDVEFGRAARASGLIIGTWPISITHQSGGRFGTPAWTQQYRIYLEKWGRLKGLFSSQCGSFELLLIIIFSSASNR